MKSHDAKRVLTAVTAVLLLALSSIPGLGATQTVEIQGFKFIPADLTVNVGDTVTWTQRDTISHTSTSDAAPPVWNSGLLAVNQSYSFTFTAAGSFPYHCIPHSATMHGTVTVQGANVAPSVQITSPADGTSVTAPAAVTLAASASDTDGTVSQVEFLDGASSLGVVMVAPYSLTVTNLAVGSHQITARATDNQGATADSAPVTVVVTSPPPVGPTVLIQGFKFIPADLTVNVGDTVTWVQKDTIQHTSTSDATPPVWNSGLLSLNQSYSFTFTAAGSFPYHCIPHSATMHGTVTVQGTVPGLPVVSLTAPGPGALYILPANITLQATAKETNGAIDHVEFFVGTNSIGVASQSPYSLIWSNVPAGSYLVTAKAFDAAGASAVSAAIPMAVTDTAAYLQHNLVSDLAGLADHTDTNLVNPWGIATSATSPFWISDNHSGLSTLYDTAGAVQTLVVTVPPPANGNPPAAPTGIVFNGGTNFLVGPSNAPARFIFATEDGTISGWNTGSNAVLMVDNSSAGAVYKGLALASDANGAFLYAADFHNGKIDVFDSSFNPISQAGAFADPSLPAGFAPFGVHFLAGNLYVTYAMQDDLKHDDVPGPGSGFVNVFDPAGHLVKRFASNGPLNSPWGMALAPAGFGPFSGALLLGNFGDGRVNAFDPTSGAYLGALHDTQNNPLSIEGLWDIKFGNGGRGGDANRLYFTAGISGGGSVEDHGLFGSISAVPAVVISSVVDNGVAVTITWSGGTGPYLLQKKASLADTNWFDVLTTPSLYVTVPKDGPVGFYRVMENASTAVIPFSVLLGGDTEVPAVTTAGTASGVLSLKGMELSRP